MTSSSSERIRILHFIDTLGAGGAERQLVYLLENLDRQRFECHVVTTYDTFRHFEPILRELGIPLHSLHHGSLSPQNRARSVARYIRLMWTLRPALVHSWLHYPNLISSCTRPFCPPHRLITAIRSEYTKLQILSEYITTCALDFRIVNNPNNTNPRNTNIPNAVRLPELYKPLESPQHPFALLMVARIEPNKNQIHVLEALHILRQISSIEIKLILIGQVNDQITQETIKRMIHEYQLTDFVEQLPPTNNLSLYYQAADATTLPSTSEGFPNVLLESFAEGRPIIISQTANRAELVKHEFNGWVFPTGDCGALAQCILSAYQTPLHERRRMSENARRTAEPYTIERMVQQYTDLYEQALRHS